MIYKTILSFVFAFGLCAILTPLVLRLALEKGWIARPSADRWHQKPTALMGGIAIFFSVAVVLIIHTDFPLFWRALFLSGENSSRMPLLGGAVLIGTTFLFILGLIDDFRNLKPHTKLIGQILSAAFITFLGFRLHWFTSLTLDTIATLFWIVGLSNAFNLIDNMDGLCAGVGMLAALTLAGLFFPEAPDVAILAVVFAGALAGFLIYNFNPAKIFMGDCGSLVIGFGISTLALGYSELSVNNRLAVPAVPILTMMVPILDTSLVTIIRILSGRKASVGGRDHTSHRLVLMGFTEKSAVLILYGVGGMAGIAAIFVSWSDTLTSPAVIIPMVMAFLLMGIYLSQLRVYPEKEFSVLREHRFTPILLELTFKRHMLLVCLDFMLVVFSYYLSYRIRFEGTEFVYFFKIFLKSLPLIIGCKLAVFYFMGIYRGIWRFISTSDVFLYIRVSLFATIISVVGVTFIFRFVDFSKGVFLIDYVFTTALMLGVRGSFRLFLETQKRKTLEGDKVLIYGAGRGGELLLREILNNKRLKVKPVGFIDDDTLKSGKKIQGYQIFGSIEKIKEIHRDHHLDGILISFNDVNGLHSEKHTIIRRYCYENGLFLKRFSVNLLPVDLDNLKKAEARDEKN